MSETKKKLHCEGYIVDRANTASPTMIWLDNDLKSEVEKYCSGVKNIYFNRLISLGLEQVKKMKIEEVYKNKN